MKNASQSLPIRQHFKSSYFLHSSQKTGNTGQYVKFFPIVVDVLIKVFSRHQDKDLLLYYIKPNESCVMSFAASLKNEPSRAFPITGEVISRVMKKLETEGKVNSIQAV